MASDLDWSRAYALQAMSDLRTYDILFRTDVDDCQLLHYLQMATEKVAKAYLSTRESKESFGFSHVVAARAIPALAREILSATMTAAQVRPVVARIRQIVNEVEALAPAVHRGGSRPDNCEYPWEDSHGNIIVPCRHTFPLVAVRDRRTGQLLKLLNAATARYTA